MTFKCTVQYKATKKPILCCGTVCGPVGEITLQVNYDPKYPDVPSSFSYVIMTNNWTDARHHGGEPE